jgi:hypothetical protein
VALLVVAAAGVAFELRRRAMHVDPPPPRGATRVTVLARGVAHGSSVLLDESSAWFTRGGAEDTSLLAVAKSGGAARTVVAHAHTVHLAGIDEAYVYYFTRPAPTELDVDPSSVLRRVAVIGGPPAAVAGPCGRSTRVAWADVTGVYCVSQEQGLPALLRTDAFTGAVRWSSRIGDGEWAFARAGARLYVTVLQRHWTCGATLFELDVDSGKSRELGDGMQCPAPLAADESGAYAGLTGDAEHSGLPSRYDVTRFPPSRLASPVLLEHAPVGSLAVTQYHVVWRDVITHEVVMAPKSGGGHFVLTDRALGDLAADASGVYFTSDDDTLVRVDGID